MRRAERVAKRKVNFGSVAGFLAIVNARFIIIIRVQMSFARPPAVVVFFRPHHVRGHRGETDFSPTTSRARRPPRHKQHNTSRIGSEFSGSFSTVGHGETPTLTGSVDRPAPPSRRNVLVHVTTATNFRGGPRQRGTNGNGITRISRESNRTGIPERITLFVMYGSALACIHVIALYGTRRERFTLNAVHYYPIIARFSTDTCLTRACAIFPRLIFDLILKSVDKVVTLLLQIESRYKRIRIIVRKKFR